VRSGSGDTVCVATQVIFTEYRANPIPSTEKFPFFSFRRARQFFELGGSSVLGCHRI